LPKIAHVLQFGIAWLPASVEPIDDRHCAEEGVAIEESSRLQRIIAPLRFLQPRSAIVGNILKLQKDPDASSSRNRTAAILCSRAALLPFHLRNAPSRLQRHTSHLEDSKLEKVFALNEVLTMRKHTKTASIKAPHELESPDSETQESASAVHIGVMIVQLARIARTEGHETLACLLDMAALEAQTTAINSNRGLY